MTRSWHLSWLSVLVLWACAHGGAAPPAAGPAAAAPAAAAAVREPTAADLLEEARQAIARKDWHFAQARLESVLAREPRNAEALFDAGFVAEQRRAHSEAVELYRKALDADAGLKPAAVNLARLLMDRPPEAEAVLRRSLAIHQTDPQLLDALTSVLVAQGKRDEAERTARQVLSRHPNDVEAHKNLAAIEAARGRPRMAESLLASAQKLAPRDPAIPNAQGLLAQERKDVAAARAFFEQAAQLDDGFAPAWINLGALALRYRDSTTAERAYAKAIGAEDRWESHLGRAWALEGLKKPKEARAEYEKVLQARPGQEDALYGRAVALKAEGDFAGALQAFRDYLATGKGAHTREAQGQIAALDLRLKNAPPKAVPSRSEPAPASEPARPKAEEGKDGGVAAAR